MALPRGEAHTNQANGLAADLGKSTSIETQRVSDARPKPKFDSLEHSVYLGRQRLGRYVQTDRKKFKAFDANDRLLGNFRIRNRMLAAIRKAAARSARS